MKKSSHYIIYTVFSIISIFFMAGLLFSCGNSAATPDPDFVAAHTGGLIGRGESIRVEFTRAMDISTALTSANFSLRPNAEGELFFEDEYTLVFTPASLLRGGQRYTARVNLDGVPSFSFEFMTSQPTYSITLDAIRIADNGEVIVSGVVNVDSDADAADVHRSISSRELGRPEWTFSGGLHRFTFPGVERLETSRTAEISWNGRHVGSDLSGFTTVVIPGEQNFELLGIRQNDGFIEVSFTSQIRQYQDLRGFVSLSGRAPLRYALEDNIIRIFGDTAEGFAPGTVLTIQDITDVNGRRLMVPVQYVVPDVWEVPDIRFSGAGTILPSSQGTELVIETRNLSGIIIEAFHIYNDNMLQFMQYNTLSGSTELDRVGEPVWVQSFDFPWSPMDQNRWVRRGLDLTELVRTYGDGMIRLRISFRPRHVQYECSASHGDFSHMAFPDDDFPPYSYTGQPTFWNFFNNTVRYNWNEWWNNRNDPCHPAFYHQSYNGRIFQSRNVLVSDLGLLARRSYDGSWVLVSTNLLSARPSPNTPYTIHNYQGRVLLEGITGSDGIAIIPASLAEEMGQGSRLFIVAENALGRAYLRIFDSISLSTSHFDVAGGSPASGLRGLIYGERGVWRPGDDIYLIFLLSDPQGSLPMDHPINFEFIDPRGRLVISRSFNESVDGFYPIEISTAPDAPTGDWTARVRVGGNVFTRSVKIETIMPNRLRMDLDFGDKGYIVSGNQRVNLEAEWLFGAPASSLRADINVSFTDMPTSFAGFPAFSFRDPSRTVSTERQNVWEGTLDDAGHASFTMSLNPGTSVPGRVTARFNTRVFEQSGAFSTEQISLVYSPYSRYVGVRVPEGSLSRGALVTDVNHTAEIVLLDEDGEYVRGNVQLNASLYKLSWRWWWEMGRGEAADIAATLSRSPVARANITAQDGRAIWDFRVDRPEWGRYLLIVQDAIGGHAGAQVVYIDWPYWAGRPAEGGVGTMLTLSTERESYNAGQRVELSFPSNRDSSALVIIEKGGEIVRSEWIRCEETETIYSFVADPSMVPNVYVHVSLFQPHLQTQNDLPIRLYGIIPVTIDDPRTLLRPSIASAEVWDAESTVSFTISEDNGRPMVYTVAVVDEGLLGLTRFNLPNPRNTFYAREASFVRTWDLFNDVIGAYSGRLETLLAIGGGDFEPPPDTDRDVQRFRPVVRFFGPYELAPGEERTESFTLPPYVGALRIMVMAASSLNEEQIVPSQRAYGTSESSVRVTSDLMVFATLPRVLSPDDEFDLPVFVTSLIDGSHSVRVNLDVPGAQVIGESYRDVQFDRAGEALTHFRVRAPSNPGSLEFFVSAESSGLRTARQSTEMEVRSTVIPVTRSVYALVQPGESWEGELYYPGRDGSNSLSIEFSRLPPINLESRLEFLIRYPHGCLEQITSGLFPQLYLDMVSDLDPVRLAEIRNNINRGIERLYSFQVSEGGFAYWPGEPIPHDWGSSYVGHFLLEARRLGYPVRDSVINDWLHYQKDRAAVWQPRNNSYSFTEQAYRLYTIALAGNADIGAMNRFRSHMTDTRVVPLQAQWRMASAYWYAGQRDIARNMVRVLDLPAGNYRELSATFGSSLRDKAMILETLILVGADREGLGFSNAEINRTRAIFEDIANALSENRWLSTQETAYSLIAMAPFIRNNAGSGNLSLSYTLASLNGNVNFTSPTLIENLGIVDGTSSRYSFRNNSPSPVYVKLVSSGLPNEGSEPAISDGLALKVDYRDLNGNIIDPDLLRAGQDMEVRVTVTNTHGTLLEELALVVPVPASWEILNTRLASAPDAPATTQTGTAATTQARPTQPQVQQPQRPPDPFRYQDIRDDRVMTYFNLDRGAEITVSFFVNLTYIGDFYRPAIHVYAMYDERIRAVIPGIK